MPPTPAPVLALSPRGRRARVAGLLAAGALLVLGTAAGSDDHFPFGPFLMYAGAGPTDGTVSGLRLWAVTADGERVQVPESVSGMRRAELEGQVARYVADPGLLRAVVDAQARERPDEPAYVRVEVVERRHEVRDRRVVGETDVVLAGWPVP